MGALSTKRSRSTSDRGAVDRIVTRLSINIDSVVKVVMRLYRAIIANEMCRDCLRLLKEDGFSRQRFLFIYFDLFLCIQQKLSKFIDNTRMQNARLQLNERRRSLCSR